MREARNLRGALLLTAVCTLAIPGNGSLAADDKPAAPATAEPAAPYAAVVTRDDTRVRAGPSANFRVLEKLPKGTLVVVTGTDAEFVRVRIPGGVPVYVHADLIEAGEGGKGTVSRSDVLMRPTPGQEYFPLEGQKLQKGDALTVLENGLGEKAAWVKVLPPDGVEYYVHATLVEKAGPDGAKDPVVAKLSADRRDAYRGGKGAETAKAAAKKAESDLAAQTESAAAALASSAKDALPEGSDQHRENLTQVMTESSDPALRAKAAGLSEDYLERERGMLQSQAKSDRSTVQEELRRRLAAIEKDYQKKLDEILKAAPRNTPRWSAVGTVRKTYDGFELVKGEVCLHRIHSLRYDLDELVNLRVGINGKTIAADSGPGRSFFRVDSLEILE